MQPNPFLTALKTGVFAILCFLVGMVFWQSNHLEDQMEAVRAQSDAVADRVGELSRKVDDVKAKADRVEGAADAIAKMAAGGRLVVGAGSDSGSAADPTPSRASHGWAANAALDANPDSSKPVGTPGRYANFLSLDPDPLIPPESKGHEDGTVGMVFGPQSKTFNTLINTQANVQESIELSVCDSPADEHWGDPYRYAPRLCWRVEVSPDYLEYTLFFRRDVVWQTPAEASKYPHLRGTHPFTARDYKFTIDTILNPQTECAPLRAYFSDCEGVTLVDDFTAVVRWKRAVYHSIAYTLGRQVVPEFLYGSDETGTPFPPETFGQQFNDHYYNRIGTVGCGPYRMLPYDGGEWITLERFEDWYGAREGKRFPIKNVRLLVYVDVETPFLKLRAGEISILGLSSSQHKKYQRDDKDPSSLFNNGSLLPYRGMRPSYYYLAWKNSNRLFRDPTVRKAMTLACDRSAILGQIWLGMLEPMGSPIYPGAPATDPSLKPLPYDPNEAARLLDAAGWALNPESGVREKTIDGERVRFEFKMVWNQGLAEVEATINHYRNDLRALGIVLTPEPLEWSLYLEKLHDRDFEAAFAAWGTNAWDQDFEQVWHSKQIEKPKSSNYIEYRNPEVDRLSDELRTEMDVEKRKEKARRVGRAIYEDNPVTFMGWVNVFGARWNWLENAVEHAYKTRPFIRTYPMWVNR